MPEEQNLIDTKEQIANEGEASTTHYPLMSCIMPTANRPIWRKCFFTCVYCFASVFHLQNNRINITFISGVPGINLQIKVAFISRSLQLLNG